jgi:hypothetical protein
VFNLPRLRIIAHAAVVADVRDDYGVGVAAGADHRIVQRAQKKRPNETIRARLFQRLRIGYWRRENETA